MTFEQHSVKTDSTYRTIANHSITALDVLTVKLYNYGLLPGNIKYARLRDKRLCEITGQRVLNGTVMKGSMYTISKGVSLRKEKGRRLRSNRNDRNDLEKLPYMNTDFIFRIRPY